jgi:hypothetical protein
MDARWTYPPEFADALAGLGLAPRGDTPPLLVRHAVDELYKYELRRLRDRQRRRETPKADFASAVVALRKKYWVLTLSAGAWEKICTVQ